MYGEVQVNKFEHVWGVHVWWRQGGGTMTGGPHVDSGHMGTPFVDRQYDR